MEEPPVPVEGFSEDFQLLPHQERARTWMKERETGGNAGGILADDMGLGKTVEAITRIVEGMPTEQDLKAGWSKTTLVVLKVSILEQWESEIHKIAPDLTVIQQHGSNRTTDPERLRRVDVVLTTYETLRQEHESFRGKKVTKVIRKALFEVSWWRCILDEAHDIRNDKSLKALACYALKARNRWCLTGTPMQNGVNDFYSLFHFLKIDQMYDWTVFNAKISKPIEKGNHAMGMTALHKILKEVMLRRTKVALDNEDEPGKRVPLPLRRVAIRVLELDPDERAIYTKISNRLRTRFGRMQQDEEAGIHHSYLTYFAMMTKWRQICDHPTLAFLSEATEDDSKDKKCKVCQMKLSSSNKQLHCYKCLEIKRDVTKLSTEASGTSKSSTKMRQILKILREIANRDQQEKTVIFSQWTSMLDLIEPFLFEAGIGFVRIDGSMSPVKRADSLKSLETKRSTKVLLASLMATGVGLNLTACNNVILVDPWWNPAVEEQAFDRVHRLGQFRDVNIIKLTMTDTVEEKILAIQKRKAGLTDAALSDHSVRLPKEELFKIFTSHLVSRRK